jgi:hypothetical protein
MYPGMPPPYAYAPNAYAPIGPIHMGGAADSKVAKASEAQRVALEREK